MQQFSHYEIDAIADASPIRERHIVKEYLTAVRFGRNYPHMLETAVEDAKRALANHKKATARPVVGQFANERGYSDVTPWEIVAVSKSGKSITVRSMNYEMDESGPKPEIIPGGFAGHCTNQHAVEWICTPNPEGYTRTIRLSGRGWDKGRFHVSDHPERFYDFNF